jgi:hypothetical protein
MTDHLIIGVRKALSADATHRHISEVCTAGPIHYPRHEVIDSIRAGDSWKILASGRKTEIQIVDACPHPGCSLGPYLAADPDGGEADDLENLGSC